METSVGEPVPLSILALDLLVSAELVGAELTARGIRVMEDDLGRPSVSRDAARELLAERREEQARRARHQREVEAAAVEADRAFRAQLPRGVPVDAVPAGLSVAQLWCASDPMDEGSRRESMLEHALGGGGIVFHPIESGGS